MSILEFPKRHPAVEPADAAARREALDTSRSFIVEAPAGSGKTGLLIQRYLCLLAIVEQPQSVLALTFTNRATAEMRQRVVEALAAAQQDLPTEAAAYDRALWQMARSVLDQDARCGWNLLAQPHRLNIRTIDSLCGEIARAVPVLCGGVGNATPLTDAEPLYRAAARSVLLRLGGRDNALNRALANVLHHRDGDLGDCEALLAQMLATREQWASLVPLSRDELDDATLDREVLPRLNAALEHLLCGALTELKRMFPEGLLLEVANLAHLLAEAEGYNGAANPLGGCAALPHAPGTEAEDVEHWRMVAHLLTTASGDWRKGFAKNHLGFVLPSAPKLRLEAALDELRSDDRLCALLCKIRDLPPQTYPADQWAVAKALFVVLHHALIELRLLFAEREVCDFTELSIAARIALAEGADRAEALNLRLDHLLVDEMQDTSSSQYELLQALTSQWDGSSQTVFLVGDPKQSIYLFRQARVERFLQARKAHRLGDVPLTPLQLTSNFRSGGGLVHDFNQAFTAVFAANRDIRYTAATPALPESGSDAMTWQPTLVPAKPDTSQIRTVRREEAESIAAFAHHWRNRALPTGRTAPWKVAVLVRSRNHALQTMQALQDANVPFRAVEMEELGERPEILDALAITRALLHPADRTAWLSVLRAPWCGLTLPELHLLAAGDQPALRKQALRVHLRDRAQALSPEGRERTLRTLDVLDAAVRERGRHPLSVDVDGVWTALLGDETTSALGRTNFRRYLELLESMEAAGELIGATSLKTRLARLYAEPNPAPGAVEVLTMHKAKGLEWDAVLLPGLHRAGRGDTAPLLDWMELSQDGEGQRQVLLAPIAKRGEDAGSLNQYLRTVRAEARAAELQRLFYVAATRARTSLQMYAAPELKKDGTPLVKANTLLHAAWPAAAEHFAAAPVLPAKFVHFPPAKPLRVDGLALAASAVEEAATPEEGDRAATPQNRPVLKRLPLHLLSARPLQTTPEIPAVTPHAAVAARPQGSLAARVLGTTVHAFLQLLATTQLHPGGSSDLAGKLEGWAPRIRTLARGSGLSMGEAEHVTAQTLLALRNTLALPQAAWIFEAHAAARNEGELFDTAGDGAGDPRRFRFDRSFLAGPAPQAPGSNVLWIVDYKTSTYREAEHEGEARELFLARERNAYKPYLEQYARLLRPHHGNATPVMLALYYPLLPYLDVFAYQP